VLEKKYGPLERRLAEEQQTFARPLRSLVQRAAVTCEGERTLAEVAALMRAQGVGSIVVVDARERPVGIVTSHDMVRVAAENSGGGQVAGIMSPDPVSLPAHALAYEAAVTMTARRIRHILVMDEGRLIGVVSERDLFALQRLGLGEITMELRLASDLKVLGVLAAEIRRLTARLVEQGVAPEQLTHFVSVLNDRLSQRVIEIVRKRHDLERISWCWLAFGSEGRFEQTLSTDQDNGLVFVAHEGAAPAQVRARMLPFAREVNEALDASGFPLCKGNIMASNPALCLSLEEWQAKMSGWIEVSMPRALLDAAICFDFRALYGDASLVVSLREWVSARVRIQPAFLRHMAEAALQARPALNLLGGFATEGVPGAPDSINLKLQGARIFVDAARIYALASGAQQTNTADRLRAVRGALGMSESDAAAAVEAFFLLQRLRLQNQVAQGEGVPDAANRVAPGRLNRIEQSALKEALRTAKDLQSRLALDYQL
jgi:CBS domain-containing protein